MYRSSKQGIKVRCSQRESHLSRTDAWYLAVPLLGFQWLRTPLRTAMAGRPRPEVKSVEEGAVAMLTEEHEMGAKYLRVAIWMAYCLKDPKR
jgi:hypothetical protein